MYERRLQILIDDDRYLRVEREARRRGVSVARVIREAIDTAFPSDLERKREAFEALMAAEPMDVPDDPADLKHELEEIRGGDL